MAEIPEIMFQQPGREREAEAKAAAGRAGTPATPPAPWADTAADTGAEAGRDADHGTGNGAANGAGRADRPRAQRARKDPDPVFPVHTVTPHPLAVQRAQEILDESGGSYTKILPGDEPGTIIIR